MLIQITQLHKLGKLELQGLMEDMEVMEVATEGMEVMGVAMEGTGAMEAVTEAMEEWVWVWV